MYTEDGAKIVKKQYDKTASLYPKRTVQEIQQSSINDWQLISFSGKVLHRGDPTVVGVKKLDLIESTFADTTGTITVSLWGNLIPVVETGKVYHIIPIQVRTWNGVNKLTTTPSSVVTEVVDHPELNGIPLHESTIIVLTVDGV